MTTVIMLLVTLTLAWVAHTMLLTGVIYRSEDPDQMIRMLLRDTYVMIILGLSMCYLFPDVRWLITFITLRMLFSSTVNWAQVYDNYYEIKKITNKDAD